MLHSASLFLRVLSRRIAASSSEWQPRLAAYVPHVSLASHLHCLGRQQSGLQASTLICTSHLHTPVLGFAATLLRNAAPTCVV